MHDSFCNHFVVSSETPCFRAIIGSGGCRTVQQVKALPTYRNHWTVGTQHVHELHSASKCGQFMGIE